MAEELEGAVVEITAEVEEEGEELLVCKTPVGSSGNKDRVSCLQQLPSSISLISTCEVCIFSGTVSAGFGLFLMRPG